MLEEYDDVLTIDDIAKIMRISRSTARRLLLEKGLPYRKIGSVYRVSKDALIHYLEVGEEKVEETKNDRQLED